MALDSFFSINLKKPQLRLFFRLSLKPPLGQFQIGFYRITNSFVPFFNFTPFQIWTIKFSFWVFSSILFVILTDLANLLHQSSPDGFNHFCIHFLDVFWDLWFVFLIWFLLDDDDAEMITILLCVKCDSRTMTNDLILILWS